VQYRRFQRLLRIGQPVHTVCGMSAAVAERRTILVRRACGCFVMDMRAVRLGCPKNSQALRK
jgi:hypothetical protein